MIFSFLNPLKLIGRNWLISFEYRIVDISINKVFSRANHSLALPFMISSGI